MALDTPEKPVASLGAEHRVIFTVDNEFDEAPFRALPDVTCVERIRERASVLAAVALGAFASFALGYVIASVSPTARVAQIVGTVIVYPMMFLSGAGMPLEILSAGVRSVSRFLPLTRVVPLVRGLWAGESWGQHLAEVGILLGILVVGAAVSARTFRRG